MKLLLDTSVLIDALRLRHRRRELLAELVQTGHTLATTALNVAEVYAGMRPNEVQRTEVLLGLLDCYDLTGASARRAGSPETAMGQKGPHSGAGGHDRCGYCFGAWLHADDGQSQGFSNGRIRQV
jgi:predicted nucleic acid-binding protein